MCRAGQRQEELISRFRLLPPQGGSHFSPASYQRFPFRHIGCNHLAEPLKVVARDPCIHVVFCMIVHTPIEKFEEGIETDGAGTKPEIRYVVLKTPMLGNTNKVFQPISDEIEAAYHDGQPPYLKDKGHQDNEAMKA